MSPGLSGGCMGEKLCVDLTCALPRDVSLGKGCFSSYLPHDIKYLRIILKVWGSSLFCRVETTNLWANPAGNPYVCKDLDRLPHHEEGYYLFFSFSACCWRGGEKARPVGLRTQWLVKLLIIQKNPTLKLNMRKDCSVKINMDQWHLVPTFIKAH